MYELAIKTHFDSAHFLRNYEGKCESLHGHTYKVEMVVRGKDLDKAGMIGDFKHLKKALKAVVDQFDHKSLNEVPPFDEKSPSTENLAKHFYNQIKEKLPQEVTLSRVTVWESEDASATYLE